VCRVTQKLFMNVFFVLWVVNEWCCGNKRCELLQFLYKILIGIFGDLGLDDGRIMICWCVGVSACVWGNETIEKNFVEVIKVV
jgi:hypothetical protein